MTTRRNMLFALGLGPLSSAIPALAQQPAKVWRVGFLAGVSRPASFEQTIYGAFLERMRELVRRFLQMFHRMSRRPVTFRRAEPKRGLGADSTIQRRNVWLLVFLLVAIVFGIRLESSRVSASRTEELSIPPLQQSQGREWY